MIEKKMTLLSHLRGIIRIFKFQVNHAVVKVLSSSEQSSELEGERGEEGRRDVGMERY